MCEECWSWSPCNCGGKNQDDTEREPRKLKILYKKNLKMSPGRIAAQAVHAAAQIGHDDAVMSVVVLGVSDKKYQEECKAHEFVERVFDAGYTEVDPNTETCMAYYE